MREKEDMRDKKYKRVFPFLKKSVREKEKNFQHVMDVGAMFIDLLKKY